MRRIAQEEAERMREALKTIAGYHNPASTPDGGQAAARLARQTLEELELYFEQDVNPPGSSGRSRT